MEISLVNFEEFKERFQKVSVEEKRFAERKEPILTVKVIAYNHVDFIHQCLDAILNQETEYDYEILIAEDDSNDGTREICLEYAKKYPDKIRLLLNSRSNNIRVEGKPTGNFNSIYSAFKIKSKYIALCEADDYWTDKHSIQKRVDFLEKNEDCVLCFHDAIRFDQISETFGDHYVSEVYKKGKISRKYLLNCAIPTSALLFRNNLIDIYINGQEKIVVGDMLLRAKLMNYGNPAYIKDISPSVYRIHQGGIFSMQSIHNKIEMTLIGLYFILDYYRLKKWKHKVVINEIIYSSLWFFVFAFKEYGFIKLNLLSNVFKNVLKGRTFPLAIFIKRLNSKLCLPHQNK